MRAAHLKNNYPSTKVSIARLLKEFVKQKTKLARRELERQAEYDEDDGGQWRRDGVEEDIDWTNLQEIAEVLGEDDDADDPVAAHPVIRFLAAASLAGIGIGNTLIGYAQAIELFKIIGTMQVSHMGATVCLADSETVFALFDPEAREVSTDWFDAAQDVGSRKSPKFLTY